MRVNTQRQDEMVDQLEQAVAMSFGPLEKLIKTANLDVDSLIEKVRSSYSGQGGPARRRWWSARDRSTIPRSTPGSTG